MIGLILRIGLLGCVLALFGWGATHWRATTRAPSDVAVPQKLPAPAPTRDITIAHPPLGAFAETVKRPLFFEGRTYPERRAAPAPQPIAAPIPPSVVAPVPKAGPPPPPPVVPPKLASTDGLKLLGVLVNKGQARALIEVSPQSGEWLSVGAKVRDWTVESISSDRVGLRQGRQSATLELYSLSPGSSRSRVR